jgi:hypothetical protein
LVANGLFIWIVYVILAKTFSTVTEYVLALVTLDDATRNRNNPICVAQPKVAKARTMVSVTCLLLVAVASIIVINSANVNTA